MTFHNHPLISEMSLYIESPHQFSDHYIQHLLVSGSCALSHIIISGSTDKISILLVPHNKYFQNNLIPDINIGQKDC